MQTVKKLKYPKKYKKRIVAGIKECNRTLDSTLIERYLRYKKNNNNNNFFFN